MGEPVAKKGDRVVGMDTHVVLIPSPAGSVPTPLPSPFSGKLSEGLSSTVFVDGEPAALVGSGADNQPAHMPIGGPFQSQPADHGTVSSGSTVTLADGVGLARNNDPVECCNDPSDQDTGHVVATGSTVHSG